MGLLTDVFKLVTTGFAKSFLAGLLVWGIVYLVRWMRRGK